MSIIDLIEQQIALHREVFGDKPTHIALCDMHLFELRSKGQLIYPTRPEPATVQGLLLDSGVLAFNALPLVY